ncbi:nuclear transport factor 2 family protein [Jiulongibacter sp. NS-SX5]|uniref:nuclear transport factor 2 family protein n=1 Tax=Jiulongibacter sp. NS-SX5 TaxID=3463854 RepID=UPI004058018B
MKNLITGILFLFIINMAQGQITLEQRVTLLEDKQALKELVDTFSNLADEKKAKEQTFLFTEDATVETYIGGNLVTSLKGREQIGDVFGNFLNSMETVFHINGQQTVDINGNQAKGTSYCSVTLIGSQNGTKMKRDIGVIYHDEYQKVDGKWLIAKRTSNFTWQNATEITE